MRSQRALLIATPRTRALIAPTTASAASGSHQGSPSGPTSVNEVAAASAASTTRIGSSAATSAGTFGHSCGAERRRVAIRAAAPSCELSTLPTQPMLEAR